MPFTISWTTATGSKKHEFETATEVLNLYVDQRLAGAVKLVIKDDRGQKLSPDDIVQLVSSQDAWMPKGPKGEKRPADVIGNAVKVMRIATGEDDDTVPDDGKNKAAQALGKLGGEARAKGLTAKRRNEIAKKAAATRWK